MCTSTSYPPGLFNEREISFENVSVTVILSLFVTSATPETQLIQCP